MTAFVTFAIGVPPQVGPRHRGSDPQHAKPGVLQTFPAC